MTAPEQLIEAARRALNVLEDECYDPDLMEYGDGYPCPRCALLEAVTQAERIGRIA